MMKAIAIASALGLAALPALAQQSGNQPASPQSGTSTQSGTSAQSGASTQQGQAGQQRSGVNAGAQDRLRQSLTQAGFQNVQIIDAAYLVQARTQSGESVMMLINPPNVDHTASTGSNKSGSGQGSSSTQPRQ